jgi:protein-S-isoprenylcysteine O-methyltransferase Ste14
MPDETDDAVGIGVNPPLVYGGTLVLGLLLNRLAPRAFLPHRAARAAGVILCALGLGIGMPAFLTMRRAHTNVRPDLPTTALVVSGPFRYTRNPLYLSMALLYAGIATFANALAAILLLPAVIAVIDRGMIAREERYLERKFGDDYRQYRARVRRWL